MEPVNTALTQEKPPEAPPVETKTEQAPQPLPEQKPESAPQPEPQFFKGNKPYRKAKVIAVTSIKGGVGKTTITANLGVLLARFGVKCLVIDGDLKLPSVGFHLNIVEPEVTLADYLRGRFPIDQAIQTHESGLKVIVGSISEVYSPSEKMKEGIEHLSSEYDCILIDTPATLDEHLKNIMQSSTEVLIVTSLDLPAVSGSLKSAKLAMELDVPIRGVVLNKVKGKDYELGIKEIEEILRLHVVASIPEDALIPESLSKKTTVTEYSSRSPAARELKRLAITIAGAEPKKGFFSSLLDKIRSFFGR